MYITYWKQANLFLTKKEPFGSFKFSIFNFHFSILLRRTNYILFIFNGVICHVSTLIFI